MLEISHISYAYGRFSPPVLSDLSLTLPRGRIGVLLGPNGAGKSTLMKVLTGQVRGFTGQVRWENQSLPDRKARIGYVPQNVSFGDLTVYDSVLTGRISSFGLRPGKQDRLRTEEVLERLGLTSLAERRATELSGGEMRKVAVARALASEPELLLFDEPTGNLDLANERQLLELIRQCAENGCTVLCSLHSLSEAYETGDCFFFLKDGAVRYRGGREQFTDEVVRDIYGARVRVLPLEQTLVITGEKTK